MSVLTSSSFAGLVAVGECSPLNRIWLGPVTRPFLLPQLGHIFLLFPGKTAVSCNNRTLNPRQYCLLTDPDAPVILAPATVGQAAARPLLLLLSPDFILAMADFLNISDGLHRLLHNVPLPQGDDLSSLLATVATVYKPAETADLIDELMLEVVGEVLRLLWLRQQALAALANRKQSTLADLLPRLLQARQMVEARYRDDLKVEAVAASVGLSEFHFARLFKAAFGESLHKFMMGLRLDEARRALLDSDIAVTELSLQVGYSSLSSFIHAFKRQFGRSPGQYRVKTKKNYELE